VDFCSEIYQPGRRFYSQLQKHKVSQRGRISNLQAQKYIRPKLGALYQIYHSNKTFLYQIVKLNSRGHSRRLIVVRRGQSKAPVQAGKG